MEGIRNTTHTPALGRDDARTDGGGPLSWVEGRPASERPPGGWGPSRAPADGDVPAGDRTLWEDGRAPGQRGRWWVWLLRHLAAAVACGAALVITAGAVMAELFAVADAAAPYGPLPLLAAAAAAVGWALMLVVLLALLIVGVFGGRGLGGTLFRTSGPGVWSVWDGEALTEAVGAMAAASTGLGRSSSVSAAQATRSPRWRRFLRWTGHAVRWALVALLILTAGTAAVLGAMGPSPTTLVVWGSAAGLAVAAVLVGCGVIGLEPGPDRSPHTRW